MNILWNTKHITKFTKFIQISIQTLLSLKKILLYLYTYLSFSNTIYTKYEKKNKKKCTPIYTYYTPSPTLWSIILSLSLHIVFIRHLHDIRREGRKKHKKKKD